MHHLLEHRLPAEYVRRLLQRGVLFWLLAQVMLAVLLSMAPSILTDGIADPASPSPRGVFYVSAVVAFLAFIETGIRRERIFIANLGVSPLLFIAIPAMVAAILSAMLMLVRSML